MQRKATAKNQMATNVKAHGSSADSEGRRTAELTWAVIETKIISVGI